jgi:hypothetical protein
MKFSEHPGRFCVHDIAGKPGLRLGSKPGKLSADNIMTMPGKVRVLVAGQGSKSFVAAMREARNRPPSCRKSHETVVGQAKLFLLTYPGRHADPSFIPPLPFPLSSHFLSTAFSGPHFQYYPSTTLCTW